MLLNDDEPVPALPNSILSATCFGLTAKTKTGGKAFLAVIDESGRVIDSGVDVARAAWLLMTCARNNFLDGRGHAPVSSPS